jgi:hypothetical protein
MAPSTRAHRSCESSKPRFSVFNDKLGFIAGLLIKTAAGETFRFRPSPNNASDSMLFVGWPSMSDGTPLISMSPLNFRFCMPRAVCVNSFSSFSSGGEVARWFRGTGSTRPEKEPVGVGGEAISSSSNSAEDRSTSGDGESSLLRSASASSDLEAALDIEGEIIALAAYCEFEGSGIG